MSHHSACVRESPTATLEIKHSSSVSVPRNTGGLLSATKIMIERQAYTFSAEIAQSSLERSLKKSNKDFSDLSIPSAQRRNFNNVISIAYGVRY